VLSGYKGVSVQPVPGWTERGVVMHSAGDVRVEEREDRRII